MKRRDDLSLTIADMFRIAQYSYYLGQLTFNLIRENPYLLNNLAVSITDPISTLQNLANLRKA